ncbi:MAG: lysophospholipid acyltransferase family protein [Planctomycetaceae bacterium]|nr:lysophospholipid acyltransferase family protein [Planctomycetaceae bacterium]
MPLRTSVRLAESLAFLFARILPQKLVRGHVARENLRLAFPQRSPGAIDDLVYGMWRHLFRMVVEIVQLPRKVGRDNMADVFTFRNRDETVRAMCSGRPVLVLGGHFGNWEVGNVAFGAFGFPVNAVARDLDNPYLHEWFLKIRRKSGGKLISKRGGGGEMTEVLARRGLLGLLCDQDAGDKGLFVRFFGRDASTFKSIALLAMEYRALIVVGYSLRLPDDFRNAHWVRYEIGCEDIIDPEETTDIEEITRRYTAALERVVRRAPEQYFWVHRRWKSKPRERVKRVRAAA